MHHQFELEEMKKDLELLLQAQGQSSLQLNQAKPPQHVQQTIVGQINYIVRQPALVQQQIEDEAQVSFKSSFLLFLVNVSSEMGDTFKISCRLNFLLPYLC